MIENTPHTCNEEAGVYETRDGERHFFANREDEDKWYETNYQNVIMGSVACSVCGGARFDTDYAKALKGEL